MTCIEKQQGQEQNLLDLLIEEKKDCDYRIDGISGKICGEKQDCYFCSTRAYLIGGQILHSCDYKEIVAIYKKERKDSGQGKDVKG